MTKSTHRSPLSERQTGIHVIGTGRVLRLRCNACGEQWAPNERTGSGAERFRCPNQCNSKTKDKTP